MRVKVYISCFILAGLMLTLPCSLIQAKTATLRLGNPANKGTVASVKGASSSLPTGYVVKTKKPPVIDGKLDDAVWGKAQVLHIKRILNGRGSASQPTEIRLLRDSKNLYICFLCTEPFIQKLKVNNHGHDGELWTDDSVEIFLGDDDNYFHFIVNSKGATYDGSGKDKNWNSGFKAAAATAEKSWSGEAAVPLGKIAKGRPERMIANFNRNRHTRGKWEELSWSPTMSGDSHMPSKFGTLLFKDPPKKTEPKPESTKKAVFTIESCEKGEGIAVFALSDIPKGTKIYRADLIASRSAKLTGKDDQILIDIEIYPLFKRGGKPSGKPLALRAPWFDRFDATKPVQEWVSGKTNGGFLVKTFPLWNQAGTALEIVYQGEPKNVPAQVTEVKAFHRSGQTFITWKEIKDPVGKDEVNWGTLKRYVENMDKRQELRYGIYRSTNPITVDTLHKAEWIATIKPLSCWNINSRNVEHGIDMLMGNYYLRHGQWNPFWGGSVDGKFGVDCLIKRFVIDEKKGQVPRATGLYVHTADKKEQAYYAVVTMVNGIQNTKDISNENSISSPVSEEQAEPEPVYQGDLPPRPFWNYPEKRQHYVRWVGPPFANLPNTYYNWSVGVPHDLKENAPVELSLHRNGYSYYKTQYRIELNSIVLSPYDFPFSTWWHGYHEAHGTLKSFKQGVIHNYTEQRVLSFIAWALKKFKADPDRVLVTAMRGNGCTGGLQLALRNPDVFNMVLVGRGAVPDFIGYAEAAKHDKRMKKYMPKVDHLWGKFEWNLKTNTGKSVWEELNLNKRIESLPQDTSLPFISMTGKYMQGPELELARILIEKGHPVIGSYSQWGGKAILAVSMTGTWSHMIRLDIRKNLSLPAFRGPGTGGAFKADKKGRKRIGNDFNSGFKWNIITDKADRYEIELQFHGRRGGSCTSPVTIRRFQGLKPEKGKPYAWEFGGQKGEITADNGFIHIPGIKIGPKKTKLIITPK
jgi:hypothetical protein